MFKGRNIVLILFAGVMALAAGWMADNWLKQQNEPIVQQEEQEETVPVMRAALDIPYGQTVEAQHVQQVEMPVSLAPEGVATSADELIGQIAQSDVIRGETLMKAKFSAHLEGNTLAALIEPNKRAITVRVNDVIGVAGFLLPGNRVDILASRVINTRAYTRTLIEDLKVLAVDQTATTNDNDPVIVRAVTLEVTPNEAETIVTARSEGPIQLSLRNPQDRDEIVRKKPRKRAVQQASSVTIIRGTSVQSSKVNL